MSEAHAADEPAAAAKTPEPGEAVAAEISRYVDRLLAIAGSYSLSVSAAGAAMAAAIDRFSKFLHKHGTPSSRNPEGPGRTFDIPADKKSKADRLRREADKAKTNFELHPRSLFVSLVSEFDAYQGRLLRAILQARPEVLSGSSRQLTLKELKDLGSVEKAVEHILDKEVDEFLRKSRADQIEWMKTRLKLPFNPKIKAWPIFVELNQRRHLFVHCDGVVSSQYVENCTKHEIELGKCKQGDQLAVDVHYFIRATACLLEIGVVLGQVLWRVQLPQEIEQADDHFTALTFNLLSEGRAKLALPLLEFGHSLPKKDRSDAAKKIGLINLAQALKWTGDDKACKKALEGEDWSACSLRYRLAVAVLADEFEEAEELVREIGPAGEVKAHEYLDWPLFREFRKRAGFVQLYQEVFGREPTSEEEEPPHARSRAAVRLLRELFEDAEEDPRPAKVNPVEAQAETRASERAPEEN